MALHFGVIPSGAVIVERLHGAEEGWYETPFRADCSCCEAPAAPEYEGICSDEGGAVHFCHGCAALEGLAA